MLKYLMLGLSRCQAAEFGPLNIRVNTVSPGMTRTDFLSDLPPRFIEVYEESLPMKRIARPEEVASVIKFLLCPGAAYVHDVNIPVTGG
jgi:NAD(P)-dependent dehydrogenase (short-subunit alcohol dehydrogenase family)